MLTWIGTDETILQGPLWLLVAQRGKHAFHANTEEHRQSGEEASVEN